MKDLRFMIYDLRKYARITLCFFLISYFLFAISAPKVLAGPQSASYELKDYGFGSATASLSSTTYGIFGVAGEVDTGSLNGASLYSIGAGLNFTLQASVSAAPSFTNPGTNYDRLKFVIDNAQNPSDTKFAISISTDNFSSDIKYIKSDLTIGNTLTSSDWLTYAGWGGASGSFVTGLTNNTTYYIRVKAMQGYFTESQYSAIANATTSDPSLTFSLDANSVTFDHLNNGNSFTDSGKSSTVTTSTNAYNGYIVYGRVTQALTSPNGQIDNYTSPNSGPTTWSGTGFGYSTNDSNLVGGTPDRFTNGGPKYAGFVTADTGDPVADHAGPVLSPISSEAFNISYRVTGNNTTKAGTYTTTVLYIVVPSY